jgi:integrase/recombinase XerD
MTRIRLPYIHTFRDRHGRQRFYFRRAGRKAVALPGLPGSETFMSAYQEALDNFHPSEIGSTRTRAGTVNAAIIAYYKSTVFTEVFAPETQRMRRNILERFRAQHGDKRLAFLQRSHIVRLLEMRKPHAQRNWLKTVRGLMAFSVEIGLRADDPSHGVKAIKVGKSLGQMTWHEPQIALYREHHKLGTVARLALELLLNIAARRYDAHVIGHQHIRDNGEQRQLCWRPHKTLRTTNKMLKVPVMPEFQAALEAMPKTDSLTFLVNNYGRPFASAAAFGNKFADWCKAAGLRPVLCDDGRVRSFRAHGLRKAALTQAAHAGCTAPELMALSGHATLAQLQVYLEEAEQERLAGAAIAKRRAAQAKTETLTCKPSTSRLQTGS